jgi:uncharacterized membrane-anchored protein
VLLVVVAQVAVVAFMAAQREWIARTGAIITLRTAPIDPNDPMRGEFVRFRYEINTVSARYFRGGLAEWPKITDYRALRRLRDTAVYAALRVDDYGFAQLVSLSDEPPVNGLCLRGRVSSLSGSGDNQTAQVRYGVEALFLQQGAAKRIELLGAGDRRGVPIDTTVAVGSSGVGVLRSFEWEPLGITVAPDPVAPPAPQSQQARAQRTQTPARGLTGVTVELKNFGPKALAIVDQPDGKSFRLRADGPSGSAGYRWVGDTLRDESATTAPRIVVLQPGEKHTTHIDLTAPRWWVEGGPENQPAAPLADVRDRWRARFRIEYAPPSAEQLRGAPHAELVRHVPVASRIITGGVD